MNDSVQSVIILTHGVPSVSRTCLDQTLAILTEREVPAFLPPNEWDKHASVLQANDGLHVLEQKSPLRERGVVPRPCLCIVLGGDGTMLRALRLTSWASVPVAGFNLGRMGFLTTGDPHRLVTELPALLEGSYHVHDLMGLTVEGAGPGFDIRTHAVNDVVVQRPDGAHVSAVRIALNDIVLFDVLCDGVIAATPAGSSGYSLAAGGPLLGIDVQGFIISFVAPHAIGVRPIVAAPADVLRLTNASDREQAVLVIDGERQGTLPPGEGVIVHARTRVAQLALRPGDSLYSHFQRRFCNFDAP